MPICFQPGRKFPIVLSTDKHLENPPTFFARALTGAETMDFADLFDQFQARKLTGTAAIKRIYAAIAGVIVGWENFVTDDARLLKLFGLDPAAGAQELPFDSEKISVIANLQEAGELMAACIAGRLSEDDSKKSPSPSA